MDNTIFRKHISIILIIFVLLSLPAAGYTLGDYLFFETSCIMDDNSCCSDELPNCCSFALPEKGDECVDFFTPDFPDPMSIQEIILQTPDVQNEINPVIRSITIIVPSTNKNPILRC